MSSFSEIDVLVLAGGLGTRIREETETKPKPMIQIGDKPILMHLINLYAKFGAKRFIILGGYKIDVIFGYLKNNCEYCETIENSHLKFYFTIGEAKISIELLDTGSDSQTAQRIARASNFVKSDIFAVTYGDSIANIDLEKELNFHLTHGKKATVAAVRPRSRFGRLQLDSESKVYNFDEKPIMNEWINGGYFLFQKNALEIIQSYETLEKGPLQEFAKVNELYAFKHEEFWQPMDTYREFELLNQIWSENGGKFW